MPAPIMVIKVRRERTESLPKSIIHETFSVPFFLSPCPGISVGCYDIYKYNIDCQWIDISEIDFGQYTFRVSINPEHKGESDHFEINQKLGT
jgi:Lysyl oxidase